MRERLLGRLLGLKPWLTGTVSLRWGSTKGIYTLQKDWQVWLAGSVMSGLTRMACEHINVASSIVSSHYIPETPFMCTQVTHTTLKSSYKTSPFSNPAEPSSPANSNVPFQASIL